MSGALPPWPPHHHSHSGGHPGRLILFGPICRAVTQQKVYLSPRESPRTITTSCLWALLWLRCTHLPGPRTGSDWHINSSSTPLSSCCVQNECHITASERLYRLISNGSSASGILPADVFGRGGTLCEVSSAPAMKNKHAVGILNISVNTTILFFPLNLLLCISSFCIYCLLSICHYQSVFTSPPLSPSWKKEKGNGNIYSCRYVPPPTYPSLPNPPLLCKIQIGLRESSYSITNRPPTRPLTTWTFFYGREKWTGLMFRHKWSSVLISLMKLD